MAPVSWYGRRNCTCMVKFSAAYAKRLGYERRKIQGGFNRGGVAASAGVHDGGGVADMPTPTWHEMTVAREMGYIEWKRTWAQGFSPHGHGVLRGCPHLASGAAWQVSAKMNRNENGLAGRGRDDGPQVTIPKFSIWYDAWLTAQKKAAEKIKKQQAAEAKERAEQKAITKKLAAQQIPQTINGKVVMQPGITAVRLKYLLESRAGNTYSRHTYVVQGWLMRVKCYTGARDGKWGPKTQAAYDKFRRQIKWGGRQTGAPGLSSLQRLGAIVRTLYPIKES